MVSSLDLHPGPAIVASRVLNPVSAIPGNNPKHMLYNIEAGIGTMPDAVMHAKMAKESEST